MSIRTDRVASLLQQELGAILQKELPRGGPIVTIVEVKVTGDLSISSGVVLNLNFMRITSMSEQTGLSSF